ncbi:MAG: hypothetical protein ACJAUP_002804 [Cellvibrionaceae bacterium]|jgi:hypothetical protein
MTLAYLQAQAKLTYLLIFMLILYVTSAIASQPTRARQMHAHNINYRNENNQPKIQLAILLDTSNGIDGPIDQARNQLCKS